MIKKKGRKSIEETTCVWREMGRALLLTLLSHCRTVGL
jgi:hypothetical protein